MRRARGHVCLPALFLLLGFPLGLFLCFQVPLGQVADEPAHIIKADSLLHGEWIGHRQMQAEPNGEMRPHEGVDGDRALLSVIVSPLHPLDTTPTRIDPAAMQRARQVRFGDVAFCETGTIASYFPAFYVAAALGIAAVKAIGGGARDAFLCARLFNLLLNLGMGALALILARRGRPMLFAVLLLPTSLGLMGSVNQDGLLIATAVLATSLATRITAEIPPWRQPAFGVAALLLALVCVAKPPYLSMGALLLPLGDRRRPLPGFLPARLATLLLILLPVLVWTWCNVHYAAAPIYRAPEEAGPLWSGPRPALFAHTDMGAQLHVLLRKPWRMLWLPMHSMLIHPGIFRQIVDVMGWLNLLLSPWLVGLWAAALCVALLGASAGSVRGPSGLDSALLLLATAATIILIYLSQYLSFTPVGWNWISGPQGRYLLPLLPMLALAMPRWRSALPAPSWLPIAPAALAAALGLWNVPVCVQAFYHAAAQ